MAKKTKQRAPPPATGSGTSIGLRCRQSFVDAVDEWCKRQEDKPTRAEAIVRLAENGLSIAPRGSTSAAMASKAAEIAGGEIDRLTDQSATKMEQATRKRRLLKGPKEFRGFRKDRSTK
jgi:hypothetical protein